MLVESADERMHQCLIIDLCFRLAIGRLHQLGCLNLGVEKVLVETQEFRFRIGRLITTIREVSVILWGVSTFAEGKL